MNEVKVPVTAMQCGNGIVDRWECFPHYLFLPIDILLLNMRSLGLIKSLLMNTFSGRLGKNVTVEALSAAWQDEGDKIIFTNSELPK